MRKEPNHSGGYLTILFVVLLLYSFSSANAVDEPTPQPTEPVPSEKVYLPIIIAGDE